MLHEAGRFLLVSEEGSRQCAFYASRDNRYDMEHRKRAHRPYDLPIPPYNLHSLPLVHIWIYCFP